MCDFTEIKEGENPMRTPCAICDRYELGEEMTCEVMRRDVFVEDAVVATGVLVIGEGFESIVV